MLSKSPLDRQSRRRGGRSSGHQELAPRVLLAEDDDEMRSLLKWSLARQGYEVIECSDGRSLLNALNGSAPRSSSSAFSLVITDMRMPDLSGLQVVQDLRQRSVALPPIILITAFGDREVHQSAVELGVASVFDKPCEIGDLIARAAELVQNPDQPEAG